MHMSKFTKSAWAVEKMGAVDPNALLDNKELSALRNISIRSLRTLVDKDIVHPFVFGHRFQRFTLAGFDADIAKFKIKSSNRDGK
jgi:hypothetical protein